MILVHQLRIPLAGRPEEAPALAARTLGLAPGAVARSGLHKISVDARRRGRPVFVCSAALELADPALERSLVRRGLAQPAAAPDAGPCPPSPAAPRHVVVCGMGPAGLFAALELARAGLAPLVLERGPEMEARRRAVARYEAGGELDENANIQFGEGGAGTFSDGKLTTRIKDPLCARVLEALVEAGAPPETTLLARPHIGTDLLRGVFTNLRRRLTALGGRVLFDTRLTGLLLQKGRLVGVSTTGGDLACQALVLAPGHSARDTFTALERQGIALFPKPFSVGFRIEHFQADIDKGLYHEAAGHPALPPGEYQLAARARGRGVYTFCMCPGGSVVAAASEAGGIVTNGMSLHARGGPNANAALVVSVHEVDFDPGALGGVALQRRLEQAAYAACGGIVACDGIAAPAQSVGSFLAGENPALPGPGGVQPSYPRGVAPCDLAALLPAELAPALREGLAAMGRKLPGFDSPAAVLTGVESRTSSPVRIPRNEDGQHPGCPGLYPCGEGAGHAGGIMSAAVDGIRCARNLLACK